MLFRPLKARKYSVILSNSILIVWRIFHTAIKYYSVVLKYAVVRRNFAIKNANKRFTIISFISQLDVKGKSFNYSWCLAEMEKLLVIRKVGSDKKKLNHKLMKFLKYIWKIGLPHLWKINWFCIHKERSADVTHADSYCPDKLNEASNNPQFVLTNPALLWAK